MKKNLFLLLLLAINFSCTQIMITPGPSGNNSPSEYMSPVVIYNAESETLTFDFSKCTGNIENHLYYERFSGGILTLHQMDQGRMIKTIIFKGSSSLPNNNCRIIHFFNFFIIINIFFFNLAYIKSIFFINIYPY